MRETSIHFAAVEVAAVGVVAAVVAGVDVARVGVNGVVVQVVELHKLHIYGHAHQTEHQQQNQKANACDVRVFVAYVSEKERAKAELAASACACERVSGARLRKQWPALRATATAKPDSWQTMKRFAKAMEKKHTNGHELRRTLRRNQMQRYNIRSYGDEPKQTRDNRIR